MFTVNFSAGAIFSLGIGTGIIIGIVAIVIIALAANKKSK
jgi:hypothetical protein